METFAKTLESGLSRETIGKTFRETGPQELPKEISGAPKPDFKPQWEGKPAPPIRERDAAGPVPPSCKIRINTRRQDLEGQRHPETGVLFKLKVLEDGREGVFPVFDSLHDAQLPETLYKESDKKQFAECDKQLKAAIEKKPELAGKFTPEQLEQIKNGETPDGYTWHHNEESGKMQLVDEEIHAKTRHTGGRSIWGGGGEYRK
jgi:hypothetical protein